MNLSRLTLAALLALGGAAGTPAPARGQAADFLTDDNAALQYWQAFGLMTDDTKNIEGDIGDVKLEGDVLQMVGDGNARLKYLYAGAAMPRCDWGLDFRTGPETLMPHLSEARALARLAILRARHRFEQGRSRDGIDDAMATFELARDVGATPVLISILVRYAIENMAIETLGRHLPKMDRAALDHLAKSLEPLPAPDSLKRVWPTESKYFVDWTLERLAKIEKEAGGDQAKWEEGVLGLAIFMSDDKAKLLAAGMPEPAKLRATLERVRVLLVELEKATDLPPAEQDARLAELQKPFENDPFERILVPAQNKVFMSRRNWQTRHALLKAAVAVQREGEQALKDKRYADPFGDGAPFEYRKTDGGFELKSKFVHDGKPVTLVAGLAK